MRYLFEKFLTKVVEAYEKGKNRSIGMCSSSPASVECSAFHRGMSVLEASLRNTEDLESVLDEKVDAWYNEDNDENSERTQYEEDLVYLPRQYPKKPRKRLLYQRFSLLRWRLLHHNYTICERALM